VYVSGFEETDLPHSRTNSGGAEGYDELADGLSVAGGYDPYNTEALQTPPYDPTAAHAVDDTGPEERDGDEIPMEIAPPTHQGRAESTVEDDLDEADFYAGQGMYPEAMDVLRNLLAHYPNHRLIRAKLAEVEGMMTGGVAEDSIEVGNDSIEQEVDSHHSHHNGTDAGHGTDAIDLAELEEVGGDDLVDLDSDHAPKKRMPTVMLENPVEEGDAETHYDLGLAYKEMGLFDDAIKAFEKTLRAPGRAVQCHVMIGMCYREQGNSSEAIQQFKQGLHATPNDRERLSLHYEIANTYESIGDEAEALYYFETVLKRDPNFADAVQRAAYLRSRVGRGVRPADADDI
jgi:tetratricopeptide (TPR) repeat protein